MPQLELDVTADAAAAAAGLGDVGAAARGMADDVTSAASSADNAVGSMDGLAAGADAVDSKMGAATGSLGALAGGLEAAGFGGAATALQGVAAATDFASGAGGLLNLVMDTQAAKFLAAKAQAVGHTVAMGAQKAATVTSTAAQWLLNAAMSANPIGLIVVALALMAGGLVLAYQKSETFRDIVDAAMGVVKDAIGAVGDAISAAIEWVKKFDGPFEAVGAVVDLYLTPLQTAIELVSAAIKFAVDMVIDLVSWISKIDFPDFPGLNPFGRPIATGGGGGPIDPSDFQQPGRAPISFTLHAAPQDQDQAMRTLVESMREYFARQGQVLSVTEA